MISAVNRVAVRTAFIATASRMVGATFRVGEAYRPDLQKNGATLNPSLILEREGIGLGLAWGISFLATKYSVPLVRRLKASAAWVTFAVTLIGNALAEIISRVIAYRSPGMAMPGLLKPVMPQPLPHHPRRYVPLGTQAPLIRHPDMNPPSMAAPGRHDQDD